MATTIGQVKAIMRRKFDEAGAGTSAALVARSDAVKARDDVALQSANESYHYWLGKRAALSELLTSIDET